MPCPVRWGRPGHPIVRTEPGVGDHLAGGGIDRLAGRAHLGRGEARRPGPFAPGSRPRSGAGWAGRRPSCGSCRTGSPPRRMPVSSRTMSPCASRCGCTLPCGNAEYSPKPTSAQGSLPPRRVMGGGHVAAELVLGHARAQGGERGLEGEDRDVGGPLHQRQLGGRLDHAAAGGHRRGRDQVRGGRGLPEPVHRRRTGPALPRRPFRSAAPRSFRMPAIERERTLVLLPDADVVAEADQLPGPAPPRTRGRPRPAPRWPGCTIAKVRSDGCQSTAE